MSLFSRKKKLIVSGCSYTDDYAKTQNLDTFPLWSELLAEKLDMDCINVGKCAAGNKEIYSNINTINLRTLYTCGSAASNDGGGVRSTLLQGLQD